ncbi:uncharacterized protein [Arachis hypogaea]|uniref:uncharacterized protein n=1 Tax=Arachis hypogaea TaxID=3818 RepID=UPI003B21A943
MLLGFIDSISINAIFSSSSFAVSLVRLFSPPQHASDAAAPCVRRRALLSPPPRRTLPKRLEVRPHVKWVRRGTEHGSVVKFQDAMHDHGVIEEGSIEALKAFSASMSEDENLPSEFASAVPQTITVTP